MRWPRVGWSGRSIAAVGRVRAWRHHGPHRGQGEASRTGQASAVLSSVMPIPSTCATSGQSVSSMQLYRPARAQQGRRSAVGSDSYHTHAHVQNLRVGRPLTRYPERGYDLMGTGDSGNGMLRQRTTNCPQRTAQEGLLPLLLWSCQRRPSLPSCLCPALTQNARCCAAAASKAAHQE